VCGKRCYQDYNFQIEMISIQKVGITDADTLLSFSKKTFYGFFAHQNNPANMEAYSSVSFTPQRILLQLTDPDSEFYFAFYGDNLAGYIKLNFNDAQTDFKDKDALEIERIYVSGAYHGQKTGKQLLNFAIDIAKNKDLIMVWIGVWNQNHSAIGFHLL
jgi:diamine N-acetyltransferase